MMYSPINTSKTSRQQFNSSLKWRIIIKNKINVIVLKIVVRPAILYGLKAVQLIKRLRAELKVVEFCEIQDSISKEKI